MKHQRLTAFLVGIPDPGALDQKDEAHDDFIPSAVFAAANKEELTSFGIKIPASMKQDLREGAHALRISMTDIVLELLSTHLYRIPEMREARSQRLNTGTKKT